MHKMQMKMINSYLNSPQAPRYSRTLLLFYCLFAMKEQQIKHAI